MAWVSALAALTISVMLWTSRQERPQTPVSPGLPDALAAAACGAAGVHAQHTLPGYGLAPPTAGVPSGSPAAVPSGSPPVCPKDAGEPLASDFANVLAVPPSKQGATPGPGASTGSFVSECGRNENRHRNSDNFITGPGVSNAAHHVHDYVGNLTTDGRSTNESLAAGGTTCRLGDLSVYFWPILRRIATVGSDVDADGGAKDGNVGEILSAASVRLEFLGNAQTKVEEMPRFLRLLTGDAKAGTNGPGNARAQWTCTGFANRVTTKYPLCADGGVQRILEFPSCWDGKNTDSANHRTHVGFPAPDGGCPDGTRAVPRLRMTLTYSVPSGRSFALDSFPEQRHNPLTDHGDFVNVMPDRLVALAVDCINGGREC